MPTPQQTRRNLPRAAARAQPPEPSGPPWAQAVHHYYDPIFNIRSRGAFRDALNDFVLLPADERAFHQAHLTYRMVLGLEDVAARLGRLDAQLVTLQDLHRGTLDALEPIREALEEIANNPTSFARFEELGDDPDDLADEREEDPEDDDPDYIYESIPAEEPPPRPARRPPPEVRAPQPPTPGHDPQREALIGELVPATEGPQHPEAGAR